MNKQLYYCWYLATKCNTVIVTETQLKLGIVYNTSATTKIKKRTEMCQKHSSLGNYWLNLNQQDAY